MKIAALDNTYVFKRNNNHEKRFAPLLLLFAIAYFHSQLSNQIIYGEHVRSVGRADGASCGRYTRHMERSPTGSCASQARHAAAKLRRSVVARAMEPQQHTAGRGQRAPECGAGVAAGADRRRRAAGDSGRRHAARARGLARAVRPRRLVELCREQR